MIQSMIIKVAVIKQIGQTCYRLFLIRIKTGLGICERALELGYDVSLPNWSEDIKDANDAVIKYGRLNTLLSIIDTATNSKIKVEVMRNKIAKRI